MVRALSRIRRLLLLVDTIVVVAYLAILLLLWIGQDRIVFPGAAAAIGRSTWSGCNPCS